MSSDHGPTGTPGGLYVKVKRRDIKKGSWTIQIFK